MSSSTHLCLEESLALTAMGPATILSECIIMYLTVGTFGKNIKMNILGMSVWGAGDKANGLLL